VPIGLSPISSLGAGSVFLFPTTKIVSVMSQAEQLVWKGLSSTTRG
jgi:hypothetical protein